LVSCNSAAAKLSPLADGSFFSRQMRVSELKFFSPLPPFFYVQSFFFFFAIALYSSRTCFVGVCGWSFAPEEAIVTPFLLSTSIPFCSVSPFPFLPGNGTTQEVNPPHDFFLLLSDLPPPFSPKPSDLGAFVCRRALVIVGFLWFPSFFLLSCVG